MKQLLSYWVKGADNAGLCLCLMEMRRMMRALFIKSFDHIPGKFIFYMAN